MNRRGGHSRLMAALFALFLGLFALAPAADAFACAGETGPVHAAAFDVQTDPDDASDPMHGVCAHGHCHHGAKAADSRAEAPPAVFETARHERAPNDLRASHAPDGLKRPPRD
jgi:hypothetical protein